MKKTHYTELLAIAIAAMMVLCACSATSAPSSASASNSETAPKSAPVEESFPSKSITVVVPFGAGGGTDSCTRLMVNSASEILDVAFVVSNQPGGSTIPAVEEFFEAEPDGYTLFAMTGTTVAAAAYNSTEWSPADNFRPIVRMTNEPQYIFLHDPQDGGRFGSLAEMLDYAKAHPGEVTIASTGAGSGPSFLIQNIIKNVGAQVTEVTFDGTSTASAAVAGGHVDACICAASGAVALMEAGNLKMAACIDTKRDPNYPDISTAQELGYDLVNTSFWGICAPKDTPDEIVNKLAETFKQALEAPSTTSMAGKLGYALSYAGPEDFKADISTLYDSYKAAMVG